MVVRRELKTICFYSGILGNCKVKLVVAYFSLWEGFVLMEMKYSFL